ncbi:MAG: NAD(P)/FAD-dependent oxidoreductase [Turicibacter sp.]|nr:NAD(P)/FAD-dependent oxidoreductase [Turicibacter sp.]
MIHTDVLIVGAGPAGLSAAIEIGATGANVILLERSNVAGGQLIKQTHMFFGSEKQYASYRGYEISDILLKEAESMPNVCIKLQATVLAAYDDGTWTADIEGEYTKIKPKVVVVATGAAEKSLPFPGNDLPGVCGAGALQTLMNQYGVKPAENVVMLGAGNIGLIVSYQLLQANVNVLALAEGSQKIGGYLVHASKLRRLGVPIMTGYTVKEALGTTALEAVTLWKIDENWQGIAGSEITFSVDALCIAVGLSPLAELLWQAGCKMLYVPSLGGYVPYRDKSLCTSIENIFIAGDVAGVEEASAAMVEGRLAGLSAIKHLGIDLPNQSATEADYYAQLASLRNGHSGEKILSGLSKATL